MRMRRKEESLALEFSTGWLIDLFLMISLISLLSIPFALAGETQSSVTEEDQAQPVMRASTTSETKKSISHAPETHTSKNSVDFLMEEPPLVQSTIMDADSSVPAPAAPPADANPVSVTLQILQGTVIKKTDEVAMLVSEKCSPSGTAADGTNSCTRVYSNGHRATVLTQNSNEGDELKHQTVVEEFDENNALVYKKTIRHRVDFNYLNDRKTKEKEFFDILYQPAGRKTTRELTIYEYFLDTGKTKSLAWTQYKQIGIEPKAELVYHALLRYGDDGSPDRGLAERWEHGEKADTFMNWSRRSKGFATLDEETWGQWEGWILNVSLQAYLP